MSNVSNFLALGVASRDTIRFSMMEQMGDIMRHFLMIAVLFVSACAAKSEPELTLVAAQCPDTLAVNTENLREAHKVEPAHIIPGAKASKFVTLTGGRPGLANVTSTAALWRHVFIPEAYLVLVYGSDGCLIMDGVLAADEVEKALSSLGIFIGLRPGERAA